MVSYSTIVKTKKRLTLNKFLDLVNKWGNISNGIKIALPKLITKRGQCLQFNNKHMNVELLEDAMNQTIAIRFLRRNKHDAYVIWDYIFNYAESTLVIRLMGKEQDTMTKTPSFLRLLIKEKCVEAYTTQEYIPMAYTFESIKDTLARRKLNKMLAMYQQSRNAQRTAESQYHELLDNFNQMKKQLQQEVTNRSWDEAEAVIRDYEEDNQKLHHQVECLQGKLQSLEVENERLKAIHKIDKLPVLYAGDENEFYAGEISDLVLATLEDALKNIPDNTRRKDIILDILNSNDYQHISEQRTDMLKKLLKGYTKMTATIRSTLERLGFKIEKEGKHYKLTYFGDHRYLTTFGCTSSDAARCGKNNASMLARMAY